MGVGQCLMLEDRVRVGLSLIIGRIRSYPRKLRSLDCAVMRGHMRLRWFPRLFDREEAMRDNGADVLII